MEYEFIDKALFFPEKGFLVIGDLHIGYNEILRQSGILVPERQVKDIIKDLENIFKSVKDKGKEVKKIIFIGDIKHAFYFEQNEVNEFREIIEFLGEILPQENIILIRGNHDTIDYTFEGNMKLYHIEEDIVFIHGDKEISEIFDKKIKTIIMGHLHPCLILESGVKKEAYKCFLEGVHRNKKVIVLPSFLDFAEGTPVNNYGEDYVESFSIIPKSAILDFEIRAIGKNKIYNFGKIKDTF